LTGVCYRLYGLTLRASRPLPGLEPAPQEATADVTIDLAGQGEAGSPIPASEWVQVARHLPAWRASTTEGEHTFLLYGVNNDRGGSAIGFVIEPCGRRISCHWTEDVTLGGVAHVLLGPVLGCVLRERGAVVLHGAVVRVNGRAVALLGASGAGKSTAALALVRQGASLLADDVTVLCHEGGRPRVQPGVPRIRLRPEPAVIDGLAGRAELVRVDTWPPHDKGEVAFGGTSASREPTPLAAIYVLGERDPGRVDSELVAEPPPIALGSLMGHRHAPFLLRPTDQARDFAALGRLVRQVPVYRILRPDSVDSVGRLAAAILHHTGSGLATTQAR
jgi:hypothetical protein